MQREPCPECGDAGLLVSWEPLSGGAVIRSDCAGCGAFRGWVEATPANRAAADRSERAQPGVAEYLREIDRLGMSAATDGEALYFLGTATAKWSPWLRAETRRHTPYLRRHLPRLRQRLAKAAEHEGASS